jgi:hypothetical protein
VEIVLNHLTRMSGSRICIAGVDVERGRHVRPVTPATDLLTRELLAGEGGPLDVGGVIDLGRAIPVPSPPETEDHRIETRNLDRVRSLDGDEYLVVLEAMCEPDLEAAFGGDLERRGWKYAVESGRGSNSLAVIRASRRADLDIDDRYGKLQLRFNDPDPPAYLSVTDLRFAEADHRTIRRDLVEDVSDRLHRGVGLYLMLGLARAFRAAGDDRDCHWLQVNGLCLEDRPLGAQP